MGNEKTELVKAPLKPQNERTTHVHMKSGETGLKESILTLQQSMGNRAVLSILQAKMRVNRGQDPYEQEADRIAGEVIKMKTCDFMDQETALSGQKMNPESGMHQETLHRKPLQNAELTQAFNGTADEMTEAAPSVEGHIGRLLQNGGMPISPKDRTFFESRMGMDLSNVRIHLGQNADACTGSLDARAFTIGSHIVFANGEYTPDTTSGKILIAHELTHVMQQSKGYGKSGSPVSNGGVIQRWSPFAEVPANLTTVEDKAAWIQKAMVENKSGTSHAILKVFKSSSTMFEFFALQELLDMEKIIDFMSVNDAAMLGTIGPVFAGGEKLNKKRAQYIISAVHMYGPDLGQVFILYIFNTMYPDDMKAVLKILASEKKMKQTILGMKYVVKVIEDQGVKVSDYPDREWEGNDVLKGLKRFAEDGLNSSPGARNANFAVYQNDYEMLDEGYRKMADHVFMGATLGQLSTPGGAAFAVFDNVSFGISSGVIGLGASLYSGTKNLAQGEVEQAVYELTGPALVVLSIVGPKIFGKGKDIKGPKGVGEFVMQEYTGPLAKDAARLNALLELNPNIKLNPAILLSYLKPEWAEAAAKYIKKDPQAMMLIYKEGIPAVEALYKAKGNLAKAAEILPGIKMEAIRFIINQLIDDILTNGPVTAKPSPGSVSLASDLFEAGAGTMSQLEVIVRQAISDVRDLLTARNNEPLSRDNVANMCGYSRDVSIASIGSLLRNSAQEVVILRYQARDVFNAKVNHAFSVILFPGKGGFIVDATFAQFMHPKRMGKVDVGDVLRSDLKGMEFASKLIQDGFIPLTEENAAMYAKGLGVPEAECMGKGARLLSGEGAMLTEVIGRGRGPATNIIGMNIDDLNYVVKSLELQIEKLTANGDPKVLLPSIQQLLTRVLNTSIDNMLQEGPPSNRPSPGGVGTSVNAFKKGASAAGDLETVIGSAVEDFRDFRLAEAGEALRWDIVQNQCGLARDMTTASLGSLLRNSAEPIIIYRFQAIEVFGTDVNHAFSVVIVPGKAQFIIDATFAQFMRPLRLGEMDVADGLRNDAAAMRVANALIRDGMVPLTEETASIYARLLGTSETKSLANGKRLFTGEKAKYKEAIGQGKGPVVSEPNQKIDIVDLSETLSDLRGLIRTLKERGDPYKKLPSMENLLSRIEKLIIRMGRDGNPNGGNGGQ
ncbi:MAG: DUF4157 domain-containing protein [Clostridia bacterium]|nr:DUF4157 domain-containing protein [Clostridia bacterium]